MSILTDAEEIFLSPIFIDHGGEPHHPMPGTREVANHPNSASVGPSIPLLWVDDDDEHD